MAPINARTLTMPMAAATMALLLFVYTRTSINAAKRNAKNHREADGGQISWRNQSLREHGQMEMPEEPLPGIARVVDRISTGKARERPTTVQGLGGEDVRIREKVAEGKR